MNTKTRVLVWDWPIRVFHWLFAATILLALGIALLGEHASFFRWHMLFGLCAGFLLLLRVTMGLFPGKPYSVRALSKALVSLPAYFRSFLERKPVPVAGHNPFAWWVYLLMFLLLLLTIVTGINIDREWAEESHSVFAWALLGTILLHLAGIVMHTLLFRENVALSMLHGEKLAEPSEPGVRSNPLLGLLLFGLSLCFMGLLFSNYQPGANTVRLPWIGTVISLGEREKEHEGKADSHKRNHEEREQHDEKHGHGNHDGDDD